MHRHADLSTDLGPGTPTDHNFFPDYLNQYYLIVNTRILTKFEFLNGGMHIEPSFDSSAASIFKH